MDDILETSLNNILTQTPLVIFLKGICQSNLLPICNNLSIWPGVQQDVLIPSSFVVPNHTLSLQK